eukprot:350444-Chlamydomonas_euryale.AAC.2
MSACACAGSPNGSSGSSAATRSRSRTASSPAASRTRACARSPSPGSSTCAKPPLSARRLVLSCSAVSDIAATTSSAALARSSSSIEPSASVAVSPPPPAAPASVPCPACCTASGKQAPAAVPVPAPSTGCTAVRARYTGLGSLRHASACTMPRYSRRSSSSVSSRSLRRDCLRSGWCSVPPGAAGAVVIRLPSPLHNWGEAVHWVDSWAGWWRGGADGDP